jgi:hypothetical protein
MTEQNQRQLDADQQAAVDAIKKAGEALIDAINDAGGQGRAVELARTKAEEAVMWATRAITA